MKKNGLHQLSTLVGSLHGLRCWYVSCGGASLPTFQLALGEKVRRPIPIKNPAHSEDYRHHEGEANLLVWCTWRLDGPDRPLTSSDDTEEAITRELARLVGARVESVSVLPPAWDLVVGFSDGMCLRVFCDHLPGEPSFDGNWELWGRQVVAIVGPGVLCTVQARDEIATANTGETQASEPLA